jgi:hypothetical protein
MFFCFQLVTKDTVDSDIYNMQERKSKMNAAIMESSVEKKGKKEIMQAAVNRFLEHAKKSEGETKVSQTSSNKENVDDVMDICLI